MSKYFFGKNRQSPVCLPVKTYAISQKTNKCHFPRVAYSVQLRDGARRFLQMNSLCILYCSTRSQSSFKLYWALSSPLPGSIVENPWPDGLLLKGKLYIIQLYCKCECMRIHRSSFVFLEYLQDGSICSGGTGIKILGGKRTWGGGGHKSKKMHKNVIFAIFYAQSSNLV